MRSVADDAGSASAWPEEVAALYVARHEAMVRLAYVLTGGDGAAEELVHDVFLQVQRHLAGVQDPSAYLRRAVVNRCVSHGRRRTRERLALLRRGQPDAVGHDRPDELRDALRRLPRRQRAAVVLRYYEDLPEAQIAELLGSTIGGVKSLLHRAMNELREVIER
jgi:RNA polymerase sigma factor (sigma-70 family)